MPPLKVKYKKSDREECISEGRKGYSKLSSFNESNSKLPNSPSSPTSSKSFRISTDGYCSNSKINYSESSPSLRPSSAGVAQLRSNKPLATSNNVNNELMEASRRFKFMTMGPIQLPRHKRRNNKVVPDNSIVNTRLLSQALDQGDLIIYVEHCFNCSTHECSLRHNENRYLETAHMILRALARTVYLHKLRVRLGVLRVLPLERRVGALEVGVLYRDRQNDIFSECLYSKLETLYWPRIDNLKSRLMDFLYESNVSTFRSTSLSNFPRNSLNPIQSYSADLVSWADTGLDDPTWKYINSNPDYIEIQWVYDSREYEEGPLFRKIQINPNVNAPNNNITTSVCNEMIAVTTNPCQDVLPIECVLENIYGFTLNAEDLERIGGTVLDAVLQRNHCMLSAVLTIGERISSVFVVDAVVVPSEGTGSSTIVKYRVSINPQYATELFNPVNYVKWNLLIGTPSGNVFQSLDVIIIPKPAFLPPKTYSFHDAKRKIGIMNIKCVFRHEEVGIETVVFSDVNGVVIVPVLEAEGRWTMTTSSSCCTHFFSTYSTELFAIDRQFYAYKDNRIIYLLNFYHIQAESVTYDRITMRPCGNSANNNNNNNNNNNISSNNDIIGNNTSLSPDLDDLIQTRPKDITILIEGSSTSITTGLSSSPSTSTSARGSGSNCCIICRMEDVYSFELSNADMNTIGNNGTLKRDLMEHNSIRLSAILSSKGKESSLLLVDAVAMVLRQSSKVVVKFRVKVHPDRSEAVYNGGIYQKWQMMMGTASGDVLYKFNMKLAPKPSLLIPRCYSFKDKVLKCGISNLQCVFHHIDGEEKCVSSDANGVVVVPRLDGIGKWTITTSSRDCVSFYETYTTHLLHLGGSNGVGNGGSSSSGQYHSHGSGADKVVVGLKNYHHIQGKGVTYDRLSLPPNSQSPARDLLLSTSTLVTLIPDMGVLNTPVTLNEVYALELSKSDVVATGAGSTAIMGTGACLPLSALLFRHGKSSSHFIVDAVAKQSSASSSSHPSSSGGRGGGGSGGMALNFRVTMNHELSAVQNGDDDNAGDDVINDGKWRMLIGWASGSVFVRFDLIILP